MEETLARAASLTEHLEAQFDLATFDPHLRMIGEHLIHSLDEAGYLRENPSEIAAHLGTTLADVEAALNNLAPTVALPGVLPGDPPLPAIPLVGADGVQTNVGRAFNMPRPKEFLPGFEAVERPPYTILVRSAWKEVLLGDLADDWKNVALAERRHVGDPDRGAYRARLAHEALAETVVEGGRLGEELHRDRPVQLLVVRPIDPKGKAEGSYLVAVDTVEAGFGETVLVVSGSSARMAQTCKDTPVDAAIVGIVDQISQD